MNPHEAACEAALRGFGRNPFADPVVRLESEAPPPHVERFHVAVRSELKRAIDSVVATRRPQMVVVRGDPGQGKTHELAWLRAGAEAAVHLVDVPPLKDAGAPFQHLLRSAVHALASSRALPRLLWETLRQVAVALRERAIQEGDEAFARRLDEVLPGDGRYVDVFRTLLRQEPVLPGLLARRGRGAGPLADLDPDFGRVLLRIADPDVERVAVDWLRGAELPDEDLQLLGLQRPLDGEARCADTLATLCRLSPRPLVLCLDQLESTFTLLGRDGIVRLLTALMELYQQLPVCIVLMCQTQVWDELRQIVPQAARERLRELAVLSLPTVEEARLLVASRLAPIWRRAGVIPPREVWPFPDAELARYTGEKRPSARLLLLYCERWLDELLANRSGASGVGPPASVIAVALPQALAAELERRRRRVEEQPELSTPALRQDRLRSAVVRLLAGAERSGRALGGRRVLAVEAPPKPRHGQRPPFVVTVDAGAAGRLRIAADVHSDDGRGAWRVLDRINERVTAGEAHLGVLLREAEVVLGPADGKTMQRVRDLEARGGGVLRIERTAAHQLVATELLLDAVSASEVWAGDRAVGEDEAMAYLLEHEELSPLVELASRVVLPVKQFPPPRGEGARSDATPPGEADELALRVVATLTATAPAVPLPRLAELLAVDEPLVAAAVERLSTQRRVSVAVARSGVPMVLLSRTGE